MIIMTQKQFEEILVYSLSLAATELAKREENKGKNIVVLLPDTGERYLSTALYQE